MEAILPMLEALSSVVNSQEGTAVIKVLDIFISALIFLYLKVVVSNMKSLKKEVSKIGKIGKSNREKIKVLTKEEKARG